jgi:hypothetical protein
VLDESAIGFIMTHGDPNSNESNSVAGVDFLYRNSDGPFGEILMGQVWAQQSQSSGVTGDDQAFGASVEIPSDKLAVWLRGQYIEENFRPALGFVNRTGIRQLETGARFRIRPEDSIWRAVNFRTDFYRVTDMDGVVLSQAIGLEPISLYSHRDDYIFIRAERSTERVRQDFKLFGRLNVPLGEYRFDRVKAQIETGKQRPLSLILSVEEGGYFGGDRLEKAVELQWRQSAYFSMGLSFIENEVDLPGGSFTSHLASFRTDVAFNSKWSWSNFLQYDNSADVYGFNSRLRYLPEAGQELVLIFNNGGVVDAENRYSSTYSDLNLKISYTFRY